MSVPGSGSAPPPAQPTPPASSLPGAAPTPKPLPSSLAVLEFVGIPRSWLTKRPRLPSRNWLIFLSTVGSIASLYYYDRRECKRIKEEYIEKVKHLAEQKVGSMEKVRKVTVLACKWPGDDEYDRSMKFFKKYVKPILVAAAVDYELKNGNVHGVLMTLISERIKSQRRQELGLEPKPISLFPARPGSAESDRQFELEGGTIIVGRHTFKEYMEGMTRGWTGSLEKVDEEELLAQRLQEDGVFDEPEPEVGEDGTPLSQPPPEPPKPSPLIFSPLQLQRPPTPPPSKPSPSASQNTPIPANLNVPPAVIPPQPPLLLVPFTNILGFRNVPLMIVDFFNQRRKVQTGSEAAYRLIMAQTRPFRGPATSNSDLAFGQETESYYRSSYADLPETNEKARKGYYEALPEKLKVARDLTRRVREPTKEETSYPPKTEVELRAERLKKEKRWSEELEAWGVLKQGVDVAWDDRLETALNVYVDPVGVDGSMEYGDR